MDIMGSPKPLCSVTGVVEELSTVKGLPYSDIAVAGVTTVYTKSMYIGAAKFFSLSYMANSAAAGVNLKIEIQQSFRPPVTEGAADTYWSEPVNLADIVAALTTENTIYHQSLPLIPLPYMRLKITGLTGNNADAIVNAWLSAQEEC